MHNLQLSSFMDVASDKISHAFGNKGSTWQLLSDLVTSNDRLILFTPNSDRIEVVDLSTMAAYSMVMPFEIESILPASEERWLIQSNTRKKYAFVKSLPANPCPNVLKEIEEVDSDAFKIGSFLSSGRSSLKGDILSSALKQNIDSPNRLLATENTFATVVVGFPELDSSNEVFVWPRKQARRASDSPIITEHGQVVRTISASEVPKEVFSDGKKPVEISAYFEIVDTVNQKARYLPIPE